jgi:hypothetical protein
VTSLGETTTSLDSVFLSSFSNSQVYVCDATKAVVPSSCDITLGLKVFGRIVAAVGLAGAALQVLDGSSPRTGRRTCTVFEALIALAGELGTMDASGVWPGHLDSCLIKGSCGPNKLPDREAALSARPCNSVERLFVRQFRTC